MHHGVNSLKLDDSSPLKHARENMEKLYSQKKRSGLTTSVHQGFSYQQEPVPKAVCEQRGAILQQKKILHGILGSPPSKYEGGGLWLPPKAHLEVNAGAGHSALGMPNGAVGAASCSGNYPPPPCESNAMVRAVIRVVFRNFWNHVLLCPLKKPHLVRAIVGVVSVKFWDFSVALAKGGGGRVLHLRCLQDTSACSWGPHPLLAVSVNCGSLLR